MVEGDDVAEGLELADVPGGIAVLVDAAGVAAPQQPAHRRRRVLLGDQDRGRADLGEPDAGHLAERCVRRYARPRRLVAQSGNLLPSSSASCSSPGNPHDCPDGPHGYRHAVAIDHVVNWCRSGSPLLSVTPAVPDGNGDRSRSIRSAVQGLLRRSPRRTSHFPRLGAVAWSAQGPSPS